MESEEGIAPYRACGRFRLENIKPLVGDVVEVEEGLIKQILPRRNELTRPYVANVDKLLIVLSPKKPASDLLLCDRMLLQARLKGIMPLIVINKVDAYEKECMRLASEYRDAASIFQISAQEGTGLEKLEEALRGSTVCLTGQSAVGKSTLLNRLLGEATQETGGLSKKTDRGRHTTRTVEMFPLDALDANIIDTPGFSILLPSQMEPRDIGSLYPEFVPYISDCRFDSCCHGPEPDCAVKKAVENQEIPRERYDRYLQILEGLSS